MSQHSTVRVARACGQVLIATVGLLTIVGSGTTQTGTQSQARTVFTQPATVSNESFLAKLDAKCGRMYCDSFVLTINNKTNKDLEIDWNKTLFLDNGATRGAFMFEGVVFRDRNNPKPPDIVFANTQFTKTIWPTNLVEFTSGRYGGWSHNSLPMGEVGVYLTMRQGQNEIRERLTVTLKSSPF